MIGATVASEAVVIQYKLAAVFHNDNKLHVMRGAKYGPLKTGQTGCRE